MKVKVIRTIPVVAKSACNNAINGVSKLPINMFSHIVCNKHKKVHRFMYGISVALFGVVLNHSAAKCGIAFIEVSGEFLGSTFHAIGLIPFIDHFAEYVKDKLDKVN